MRDSRYGETALPDFRSTVTLALLACAAALPARLHAQETVLQGRVLERAALGPVAGAAVKLAGHPEASGITDAKGLFKITYASAALRGRVARREILPAGKGPSFFRWLGAWHDADGKRGNEGFVAPAAPLEADAFPGPSAKASAGTSNLDVSCAGLMPKSVAVTGGTQDLGDIILDYPPRKLDIGAPPIYGSIALFDGKRATMDSEWQMWMGTYRKANNLGTTPIDWLFVNDPVDSGMAMETCCRAQWGDQDLVTKRKFRDFQLHVEFNLVKARADAAGAPANSGVYLQSFYEIQIKDDYGLNPLGNHDAGGILNETAAPVNESRMRGQWQAYDITYRAARFLNGARSEKARLTMYWNGKLVHLDKETANEHAFGVSSDSLVDEPKGLKLQSEGHDVRFRNIWLKELDLKAPDTNVGY